MFQTENKEVERPPRLGGGPFGYGDPDDKKLRKSETDTLIPKLMREEATKRCSDLLNVFLNCAKESGLLVTFKCRAENDAKNKCVENWCKNPEFVKEMTDLYIERRSHYRRTGQPLVKYERKKKTEPSS